VRIVGYVPCLEEALMPATVFVAPHRFAAGVQNKVLQALASGIPVVSTPAVKLGLEPMPDGVMRIAESSEGIAAEIVSVIRDPVGAAELGTRGRDWARATFSWRTSLEALESNNGTHPEPTQKPLPFVPAGV
jgi:glycosyltransferase involved in cell wall biosynthesis